MTYRVQVEDRRADGGPFVVFVRRQTEVMRARGVGPSCVGVGADFQSKVRAAGYALAEVHLRRRVGQFR